MRTHLVPAAVLLLALHAPSLADPQPAANAAPLVARDPAPLAPLRLPAVDNKPVAVSAGQRVFRLPMRFARVEAYYRALYATDAEVRMTVARDDAGRTLTLQSRKPGDAWAKAVIREAPVDTVVEVTPVIRLGPEVVEARPQRPLVQFVFKHADEVQRQANSIDHLARP